MKQVPVTPQVLPSQVQQSELWFQLFSYKDDQLVISLMNGFYMLTWPWSKFPPS
jgi:hypothetical protein